MPNRPEAGRVTGERDLVALGRENLTAFARWPLGMRKNYELWGCQREWLHLIQEHYFARLKDPKVGKHLAIIAPSQHGKTTGIVLPFVTWVMARNRNLRVIVAGSKDNLAENIGYGVDRQFANNSKKLEKFGLLQGTPWKSDEKYLQRDNDMMIHPSMLFVGPTSEFQGKRADLIVVTDLATFKNQRTPESRKMIRDFFYDSLEPRLEPWGFILVEGHRVMAEDFYSELEEDPEFTMRTYRAIVSEPGEAPDGRAVVLAPEQWDYERLHVTRSKKPVWFRTVMQNSPTPAQSAVSRESLERAFDRSRHLLSTIDDVTRAAYKEIQMRVDLAFSVKRWSHFSVCLIVGVTESGQRDVLAGWRLKLLPHQLEAKLVSSIHLFRPDRIFIESNAAQIIFIDNVRKHLDEATRSRVFPVLTESDPNNPDNTVERGVSDIIVLFETGQVTLPYAGQAGQELSEQFVAEIVGYPPTNKHKSPDVLMAFHVGERGMKNLQKSERKTTFTRGMTRSIAGARHGRGMPTTQGLVNDIRGLK